MVNKPSMFKLLRFDCTQKKRVDSPKCHQFFLATPWKYVDRPSCHHFRSSSTKNTIGLAAELAYPSHVHTRNMVPGTLYCEVALIILKMKKGNQHSMKTPVIIPTVMAMRVSLLKVRLELSIYDLLLIIIPLWKFVCLRTMIHTQVLKLSSRSIGRNMEMVVATIVNSKFVASVHDGETFLKQLVICSTPLSCNFGKTVPNASIAGILQFKINNTSLVFLLQILLYDSGLNKAIKRSNARVKRWYMETVESIISMLIARSHVSSPNKLLVLKNKPPTENGTTVIPTNTSAIAREVIKNFVKYLCLDFNLKRIITAALNITVAMVINIAVIARIHLTVSDSEFTIHVSYISSQETFCIIVKFWTE